MTASGIVDVLTGMVERKPFPSITASISVPPEDDEVSAADPLGYAEGQSFIIEYLDTKGRVSVRRITVWSIEAGAGGMPCLYAKCHERQAMRQFRVDRIRSCADYDGEVRDDVMEFLAESFGAAIAGATETARTSEAWFARLDQIRADAVLLACVSLADGSRHEMETEVIADHVSRIVEASGEMMTAGEISALVRYVRRLRPQPRAIAAAIDEMRTRSLRQQRQFFDACRSVMDADGVRKASEADMIQSLVWEITGSPATLSGEA